MHNHAILFNPMLNTWRKSRSINYVPEVGDVACRGEGKIVFDLSTHEAQYPKFFDPNNSMLAKELGK